MSWPKSCVVGRSASASSALHEHLGVEDVDAHGGEGEIRRAGNRARRRGLLLEAGDALLLVDGDDAEARAVADRHFDRGEGDRGVPLLVEAEHAGVVHLVDVIAGQDDDVPRALARDRVQVLVDGVRRALVPVLADALLRRQDLDELAELLRDDVPAHADVAVERQRLVLRRDEDAAQPGVDAVAQGEVDDPVRPAEVDRRLGAILRQRIQALAGAAGEHDHERVVEKRGHRRFRMRARGESRTPSQPRQSRRHSRAWLNGIGPRGAR